MSITFECPWCLKRYTLSDESRIKEQHRCKDCNADLIVTRPRIPCPDLSGQGKQAEYNDRIPWTRRFPAACSRESSTAVQGALAQPKTGGVDTAAVAQLPYLLDAPAEVAEAAKTRLTVISDKYVIVKKLGQGGMGAVFKAWDTSLKRYVALKMILSSQTESADDNEKAERFVREAQTAAKLVHPNILQVDPLIMQIRGK